MGCYNGSRHKKGCKPLFRPAFLTRSPRPPLGKTERFSGGHEQRPLLNTSAVILQNLWWAGGHNCWQSLEGGHQPWNVENHWFRQWFLILSSQQMFSWVFWSEISVIFHLLASTQKLRFDTKSCLLSFECDEPRAQQHFLANSNWVRDQCWKWLGSTFTDKISYFPEFNLFNSLLSSPEKFKLLPTLYVLRTAHNVGFWAR